MATLEDAAEELVVKLRGLDAEIEESDRQLTELREKLEAVAREVEEEWTDLSEAVGSLLQKVGEEGKQLDQQVDETLQAVVDAHNGMGENAAASQNEIREAAAELDALGQQATALEPTVESLVAEGVEAPARSLAERARELEQELARVVDEARDFLRDEVVPAVEQVGEDVRERCEALHKSLTEERVQVLQEAFDEWEGRVDELEDYILKQGYEASHQHAQDVVAYAMEECETASLKEVDELQQLVGILEAQLQELATSVQRAAGGLAEQAGAELLRELDEARAAAEKAVGGLDKVKQELAERSFMEA